MSARFLSIALSLVVALGGCRTTQPAPSTPASTTPLDVVDLFAFGSSPGGDPNTLPEPVAALLATGDEREDYEQMAARASDGRWFVAACRCTSRDDDDASICDGTVARSSELGVVQASRQLFAGYGHVLPAPATIDAIAVLDLAGDGALEVIVRWSLEGEPEAAVGSPYESWLGIYRANDLAPLFEQRVEASGAGAHDDCESTLRASDDDRDGLRELHFFQRCMPAVCRVDDEDDDENGDGVSDAFCPDETPEETRLVRALR